MPTLLVYNLGELGVDIVNSPLHTVDGSFEQTQNAQLSTNDAEIALKKRDGMSKINSSVAAGSIIAIANIKVS